MMYNFSSLGINCSRFLGALNEKALPTNEFGGMGVFKEMLADDRRALVGLYISIESNKTLCKVHTVELVILSYHP